MNVERGFRRIATLVSVGGLGSGLLFTVLIAGAWAWSAHLDRQRETMLFARGCGRSSETPVIGLVRLGPRRWRVTTSSRSSVADKPLDFWQDLLRRAGIHDRVVTSNRDLSEIEVVNAAHAWRTPGFGSVDSSEAGVEVFDCVHGRSQFYEADQNVLSNKLIHWWLGQSFVSYLDELISLPPNPYWSEVIVSIVCALGTTAAVVVTPWGAFYLLRWIIWGFTSD